MIYMRMEDHYFTKLNHIIELLFNKYLFFLIQHYPVEICPDQLVKIKFTFNNDCLLFCSIYHDLFNHPSIDNNHFLLPFCVTVESDLSSAFIF